MVVMWGVRAGGDVVYACRLVMWCMRAGWRCGVCVHGGDVVYACRPGAGYACMLVMWGVRAGADVVVVMRCMRA